MFQTLLLLATIVIAPTITSARTLESGECGAPAYYDKDAFHRPMEFFVASSKGNMRQAVWIAGVGKITTETPDKLRSLISQKEMATARSCFIHPAARCAAEWSWVG